MDGIHLDFAAVAPTMGALALLAIELIVLIPILKFAAARFPVPGLSDLIASI
jgi:hypothetical protein